jgi:hypothetical protein
MNNLGSINWDQVIACDAHVFRTTPKPKWPFVRRNIKASVFVDFDINADQQVDFLCFRSLNRQDYKNLFDLIVATIDSPKLLIDNFSKRSSHPNLRVTIYLLFHWRIFFGLKSKSLAERIYVYIRACSYLDVLRKIERISFNKLLVFADMQPLDNLLTQYFSDKITITVQHGLYVDYKDSDTINTANYLHQPSKYFLAWGEDTRRLIRKYNPARQVVICGKPNIDRSRETEEMPDHDFFSVIFDQNIFQKYNVELLKAAYEFSDRTGMAINLRLHPWNNPESYQIDHTRVQSGLPLSKSSFVIGHTTSMIYELMREGIPAYKLRSKEFALATPDSIQFTDATDLMDLHKRSVDINFKEIGRNYISLRGEESLNAYRDFFRKLQLGDCRINATG